MKIIHYTISILVLIVSIISCKNEIIRVDSIETSSNNSLEIEFKKYESKLDYKVNDSIKVHWNADWKNIQSNLKDASKTSFIPLNPELINTTTGVKLSNAAHIGVTKYIIVKNIDNTNTFFIGSYFSSSGNSDINNFTGKLILEQLGVSNVYFLQYTNGRKVEYNKDSIQSNPNARTSSCITYEFCSWSRTHWGMFYILETQGINECDWPREDPQSWTQTFTRYEVQCDGMDPYDPGSGYIPENPGGSGTVEAPSVPNVFPLAINGVKVDPTKELKCFDKTANANLKIFVQQPNAGTRDKMGPRQVGHAFVGIEQDGVTRYLGYYPESNSSTLMISVGASYPKEIRDNSGELYDVSISKQVNSTQLTSIINFIINAPSTYNLNNYNCTDFAIDVASKGGISLPKTTSSELNFKGRNPGDLGEDIRGKTLASGETRTTNTTNASQKSGSCN